MTDFNEFTLDLTQYNGNEIKLLIFLPHIQICLSLLNVLNNVFFLFIFFFFFLEKNKRKF